jgi:hypothetical protein
VHVYSPDGEAKFWLEPGVEVARNYRLSKSQMTEIEAVIRERKDEIRDAWEKHFRS